MQASSSSVNDTDFNMLVDAACSLRDNVPPPSASTLYTPPSSVNGDSDNEFTSLPPKALFPIFLTPRPIYRPLTPPNTPSPKKKNNYHSSPSNLRESTTLHTPKIAHSNSRRRSSRSHKDEMLGSKLPGVITGPSSMRGMEWIRKEAEKIKKRSNSPVNKYQRRVLRMIYDEITMFPIDRWNTVIGICIQRSGDQVKNWFSNERQKNPISADSVRVREDKVTHKLLPSAVEATNDWRDDVLEGVVRLTYFAALCDDND